MLFLFLLSYKDTEAVDLPLLSFFFSFIRKKSCFSVVPSLVLNTDCSKWGEYTKIRKYTVYTPKEVIASKGFFQTISTKFGFCCFFSADLFTSIRNSIGKPGKDIFISIILVQVLIHIAIT